MNRYDNQEFERQFSDEGQSTRRSSRQKPKKHRKLWIPVTGILTALTVASVAVISVSAGSEDAAKKEQVSLQFAELSSSEADPEVELTGFVLTDVSDVVEEVLPSVVSITSRSLVNYYGNSGFFGNGGNMGDMNELWDMFFGDSYGGQSRGGYYYELPDSSQQEVPEESAEPKEQEEIDTGMGSGTIIGQNSSELLILTSYHVVDDSSSLYVTFINGSNVDGYIKAADYAKDIAVVAIPLADIDEETMSCIKIATISKDEPKVGEGCLVIGNALGYGISVTSGIVSKTDGQLTVDGRTLDVIQTDAAINFGNSGGCMVNANGEIIGIAEAKTVRTFVEGMCYAISIAKNIDVIEGLMNEEEPFDEESIEAAAANYGGFLGIRGRDVDETLSQQFEMPEGIYVSSIVEGSGAEEAGIQVGDIIIGFEGESISTMAELQYLLSGYKADDTVSVTVNRLVDGAYETMDIEVTLTDRIS